MQIVIDISDELKEYCDRNGDNFSPIEEAMNGSLAMLAIKNGTPLPKGHGRLIDVDKFIDKATQDRKHACYTRSWSTDDVLKVLSTSYTPTASEADKKGDDNGA